MLIFFILFIKNTLGQMGSAHSFPCKSSGECHLDTLRCDQLSRTYFLVLKATRNQSSLHHPREDFYELRLYQGMILSTNGPSILGRWVSRDVSAHKQPFLTPADMLQLERPHQGGPESPCSPWWCHHSQVGSELGNHGDGSSNVVRIPGNLVFCCTENVNLTPSCSIV